jgi:TRAP-type mannitol/chloroaromatic compound transport system substrate-binding protein
MADRTNDDAKTPDPLRRSFLTGGLVGGACGILGSSSIGALRGRATAEHAGAVRGRPQVEWRLASSFPQSLDTIYGAAVVLAERVAAMTDGAFRIRVHQADELVPALQVLDAVQAGSAEVGQTGGYYYIGKSPALAFDTCVPFGLTPRQQKAWLYEAGGLDLVRSIYADFGVISFPCGNTGTQMGGWFRNPVETLADLRGLRMRIPGLGGRVMDALGVSVQNLSGREIYPALERGVLDAVEWVGPSDDEKLGFWRIARHYYYPGWWEPGPSLSFLVNLTAWNALSADYRAIFEAAAEQAYDAMQRRYDARNPPALQRLLAQGVELRPFSIDILRAARDAAESLLDTDASKDPTYRKLLDHWRRFRDESKAWFRTSELSYAQFAWGES